MVCKGSNAMKHRKDWTQTLGTVGYPGNPLPIVYLSFSVALFPSLMGSVFPLSGRMAGHNYCELFLGSPLFILKDQISLRHSLMS